MEATKPKSQTHKPEKQNHTPPKYWVYDVFTDTIRPSHKKVPMAFVLHFNTEQSAQAFMEKWHASAPHIEETFIRGVETTFEEFNKELLRTLDKCRKED